jgi:hypothetical protein
VSGQQTVIVRGLSGILTETRTRLSNLKMCRPALLIMSPFLKALSSLVILLRTRDLIRCRLDLKWPIDVKSDAGRGGWPLAQLLTKGTTRVLLRPNRGICNIELAL